ncbi:hypothetical protein ASPWEDRAFT_207704 [Aspergillus wentii DTO 134E9]|uniref:Uncharacterized protein n=1 Tax=Aspergillus wentii DTO 134E9 TaxID=1073089 RepID=A0A1L9RZX6_ASPWE|nr:uncharacterized protein ASPWEDRAFT_207704 [Aspergillus wentii DTO 134E9]OJJ40397.1 hypothetical protein ASPWEDRAFT_207704 [Aspergillus wentii DTO 134E9]
MSVASNNLIDLGYKIVTQDCLPIVVYSKLYSIAILYLTHSFFIQSIASSHSNPFHLYGLPFNKIQCLSPETRPNIDNLPPNTPTATGHSASAIHRFVDIQLQKPHPPAYVVFTNVPPNVVGESRDNPRLLGPKGHKICYDEELRHLILKLPRNPS